MQNKQRYQNQLDLYRRRMRFTTSHVAHLLGHQGPSTFREYDRGARLPTLITALRLGIILRVPVEFLFGPLHDHLKGDIRAKEERMAEPAQQPLF